MSQTIVIGENTAISMKVLLSVGVPICGFIFWLTTMYFDVQSLKRNMESLKDDVRVIRSRVEPNAATTEFAGK